MFNQSFHKTLNSSRFHSYLHICIYKRKLWITFTNFSYNCQSIIPPASLVISLAATKPRDFDKLSACNTRLKSLQTLPSFDGVLLLFIFFSYFCCACCKFIFSHRVQLCGSHALFGCGGTAPTVRLFTLSRRCCLALMYSLPAALA